MIIYDRQGTQISASEVMSDIPITASCQHVEELMKDDYVTLSWEDATRYTLPIGSYIIPYPEESEIHENDSRYPVKFMLFGSFEPEIKNETHFLYEPHFEHPLMWLKRLPMMFITGDITSEEAIKKTTWGYTGSATYIAQYIVKCMNWLALNDATFNSLIGGNWNAIVDSDLRPSATVNFASNDIWSTAGLIAQAFDCEFCFDFAHKMLLFGDLNKERELYNETPITLKVGVNVGIASFSRTRKDYFNSYLIKGSTKNLAQPKVSGEYEQVLERLTLDESTYPDSTIYIDESGNYCNKSQFQQTGILPLVKEYVFDEIYPKLELYVYNCRERQCYMMEDDGNGGKRKVYDGSGNPILYSKWYIRLAYPIYNTDEQGNRTTIDRWEDYLIDKTKIIDGQTLQISFLLNEETGAKSSLLIGQGDFDLVYFEQQTTEKEDDDVNPNGFTAQAGDYRIVFKQTENLVIPTTSNGGMYPQEYDSANHTPDIRSNKATLINIAVSDDYKIIAQQELEAVAKRKIRIEVADRNNYTLPTIPSYFEENDVPLRVGQRVVYNDGQDQTGGTSYILETHIIKIVTQIDYPFVKEITIGNEKVKGTISTIQERIETIIAGLGGSSNGEFTESQFALLLQTYGSNYFLSKIKDDTAKGIITFLRGICFGASQDWKITGDGDAILHDINAQNAIFNTLTAQNAHFFNLIIDEIYSVGGQMAITATNCKIDFVKSKAEYPSDADMESGEYKCYFKATDGNRAIYNQWRVGMQAIHMEFNVAQGGSRNYWRIVHKISSDPESITFIDSQGNEQTMTCHWIVLTDTRHQREIDGSIIGNSAPQAGDDLSQLGFNEAWYIEHYGNTLPSDYKQLENAIILSAYNIPFIDTEAFLNDVNGIKAPLYVSYRNINSFNVGQENRVVAIAGNGNLFRGQVVIEQGSTLADGRDVNNLGVQEGNLLRNSGFTGDYESIEVDANLEMSEDTEVYSEPLKYWVATNANGQADASAVEVIEESYAVSGYAATIDGKLSQNVEVYPDTWYMLMFKAYVANNTNGTLTVSLGGVVNPVNVTYSMQRFALPIHTGDSVDSGDKKLVLSGEGISVYDLMLVQGNIPTEYKQSEKDNDKTLAELLNLEYLKKAIYEANTEIIGGLIMSQLIKVGNYVNGQQQNTGGMSGLFTDGNSPFLWGGGTFEQAIETIMYYASRRPEHYYDEEPEGHVNFAVTHGGTAILNDIILRGYINAIGGIFKNVRSANGKWSLDEDGYMRCVNAWVSGSIYTPYTIINNDNIEDNSTIRQITIRWGITEITRDVRVLNLEKTGFNLQIDYLSNESMPLFIMLPEDDGLIGAEVNVFQNSIHRCALVHISKVSMDDNRNYEYFNPILLKGQKIKLKCFKDGDTNRWFPEAYTDALRFRTPLEIAYVEVEVIKVNDEWILREIVGRYHSEARFQYVRDNVGKYIVTLPSDWRSVGVIGCDIVPHSYVMMEYNRGAYASVIDKDPVNSSFTIQVADDDSVNDGNFGFTIYLNRDEESIDINPILNNE